MSPRALSLLAAFVVVASARPATGIEPARQPTGTHSPGCAIDEGIAVVRPHGSGFAIAADCPARGPCDDPAVRDTTALHWLNLRAVVHVFRQSSGAGGVSQAVVDATIAQMNHDYRTNGTGVQIDHVATRFHNSDTYYCLPPCEELHKCQDSFSFLRTIKSLFAEDPEHQLNIYFTCHPTTANGSLAGIAYYPWSSAPIGTPGGFWVNVASGGGAGNFVATHELGHNLGLYHTFRGVDEIENCDDPCVENVGAPDGDLRGDLAGDTPPTPVHPDCAGPAGVDCVGSPWGSAQPENFMGYGPPGCQTLFTPDQIHRIQCWTRQSLRGWLSSPPATCERLLDATTNGLWHCGEAVGSSVADALGGPSGELIGGAAWGVSGCGSTALVLDGPGQGLRLPREVVGRLPAGTVECTFQWDGSAPNANRAWIFDQSAGPGSSNLGLALAPDSTLHVYLAGSERLASTTRIRPGRWNRVAVTWDGANARLDLDDLMDSEAVTTAVPDSLDADLWFGSSGGTVLGGEFSGSIDEIRISHVARFTSRPATPLAPELRLVVAPNPAAGSVGMSFVMSRAEDTRLEVFDLAGRRVALLHDGDLPAGSHALHWNGNALNGARVRGGVYVVRLMAGIASMRRTFVWMP